jgi:hypothetical protein
MKKDGKPTKEKPKAGAHKPTGINQKVTKESVPQRVAKVKAGVPTQTQKL